MSVFSFCVTTLEMKLRIKRLLRCLHNVAQSKTVPLRCFCGTALGAEGAGGSDTKPFDTRSFIMSRPQLEEAFSRSQRLQVKGEIQAALPRTVQTRCRQRLLFFVTVSLIASSHVILYVSSDSSKEKGDYASPKFIVTLDGIPSPLGNLADCEMDLDDVRPPTKGTEASVGLNKEPKVGVLHRLHGMVTSSEGVCVCPKSLVCFLSRLIFHKPTPACPLPSDNDMDVEMEDEDAVPLKKHKAGERCKFWPVCKSGDACLYHHPTTHCK